MVQKSNSFYKLEITSKHHLTQTPPTNSFKFEKAHATIKNIVVWPSSSTKSQLHHPAEGIANLRKRPVCKTGLHAYLLTPPMKTVCKLGKNTGSANK